MTVNTVAEASTLLQKLGASQRLIRHVELVGEAAAVLLATLAQQGVQLDEAFVRVGVVLHDAGKAIHQEELSNPGAEHEPTGERLLLDHGVPPKLARVCKSHAQWASLDPSLEELVIALADKLWKGVRVPALEELVIARAATAANRDKWDLFIPLDAAFEDLAAGGDDRLARSRM
jgi:predicted hydrolase (HD superfamily)